MVIMTMIMMMINPHKMYDQTGLSNWAGAHDDDCDYDYDNDCDYDSDDDDDDDYDDDLPAQTEWQDWTCQLNGSPWRQPSAASKASLNLMANPRLLVHL